MDVFCVMLKLADVSSVCPLQHSVASGYVTTVSMTTTGHWSTVPSVIVLLLLYMSLAQLFAKKCFSTFFGTNTWFNLVQ